MQLFGDRFPREEPGFYKFGKPKADSLLSFSMKPRRPQSEHALYEGRLRGVLVAI
ncbi:hypothetical protein ACQEU6_26610 [Spirillospora sp. CA-108201]